MAKREATSPEALLHSLINPEDVRTWARRLGFLKRKRKIDAVAFLSSVVLGLCGREGQSIASMRRDMALRSGTTVVRSSFFTRLSEPFERLVSWALDRLQQTAISSAPTFRGVLEGFHDVIAVDATVIKVQDNLARLWKGTRHSRKAAVKVHTWIRATTGELLKHRITAETYPEARAFGMTRALKGMLFLFDMGFPSAGLWFRIHRLGGFFLTRLPRSHRPTIVSVNRTHRGRARKLVGAKLQDVVPGLKRGALDVDCAFNVHIRGYGGRKGRMTRQVFRVIGIYNPVAKAHHLYVTNLPLSRLDAVDAEPLYRLRWEVETFYKVNKSGLGLNEITSGKPHIVRTMLMAALLRGSICMQAKRHAERYLPSRRWINPLMWTRVWTAYLDRALDSWMLGARRAAVTWRRLALLAMDPERSRPPTRRWIEDLDVCDFALGIKC
jgi:hypothetical protein